MHESYFILYFQQIIMKKPNIAKYIDFPAAPFSRHARICLGNALKQWQI